jgi:hypothetical protein
MQGGREGGRQEGAEGEEGRKEGGGRKNQDCRVSFKRSSASTKISMTSRKMIREK